MSSNTFFLPLLLLCCFVALFSVVFLPFFPFLSRKLAVASWSPSCFSKEGGSPGPECCYLIYQDYTPPPRGVQLHPSPPRYLLLLLLLLASHLRLALGCLLVAAACCLHACCCWMLAACCLLSAPFCWLRVRFQDDIYQTFFLDCMGGQKHLEAKVPNETQVDIVRACQCRSLPGTDPFCSF